MKHEKKHTSHPGYSQDDMVQLKKRHLSFEQINAQIDRFKKGILPLTLSHPCTIGNGIKQFSKKETTEIVNFFDVQSQHKKIVKFVPASGAATRMFHHLLVFKEHYNTIAKNDTDRKAAERFFAHLQDFGFYDELSEKLKEHKLKVAVLLKKNDYIKILDVIFAKKGLHYGNIPKALIKFHKNGKTPVTSLEEHLVEAAKYAKDGVGNARVIFTVSPEFKEVVKKFCETIVPKYEQKLKVKFHINFSVQKPVTDSVAVDLSNKPFRDEDGRILFRPAGHGALLDNLGDVEADVIFIKNIDNVQPDRLKDDIVFHKKVLGGYLLQLQGKMYSFLEELETGDVSEDLLDDAVEFCEETLSHKISEPVLYDRKELIKYLYEQFHRPLRVCGVVKSQGEPGGAPFWVKNHRGSIALQIVERAQVNTGSPEQLKIFNSSTHFNPVDLVCATRNHKGEQFDLRYYRDTDAGFISIKSHEGKQLKSYELPGLWNGSMAFWNTVFVEVPLNTFSPVKTINDLLRKEHQN